jgi:predicted  nucleic acid-binding Zn-ribbon protein
VSALSPTGLTVAIGLIGLAGLIFTALRFRRDDTTAIVQQQSTLFDDMKTLNDELRVTTEALRDERDSLKSQVERLTGQVDALRTELRAANASLSDDMGRIERKLDDA